MQQQSWGKGLVILTIIIAITITVTFFSRLTADAQHSYHIQVEAKKNAIKKKWLTEKDSKSADALMKRSDCIICHNPALPSIIAPQFTDIAKKYVGVDDKVIATLVAKVRKGGNGNWQPKYVGIMTPHSQFIDGKVITDADIVLMVKRILDTK